MTGVNWNGDATTAPFSSRFDEASGNLILAEDNNGNTVLLEWDGTMWQYRGPVEMNGEDVSGVGTLTATNVVADSVSTEQLNNGVLFASEFATGGSGTVADPYLDGVRHAVESTNDVHIVVVDGIFLEDPINVADGAFEQWREGTTTYVPPAIVGFSKRASQIVLKDGSNDHLLKYDIPNASITIDENLGDPTLIRVGLVGNKDGQDSASTSHAVYCQEGADARVVRGYFANLYVRWFQDDGFEAENAGESSKSVHVNVDASYQGGTAWKIPMNSTGVGVRGRESQRGVAVAKRGKMIGGACMGNAARGASLSGISPKLYGVEFEGNNNGSNGDAAIIVAGTAEGAVINGCDFDEPNVTETIYDDGTETKITDCYAENGLTLGGFQTTRQLVNGIGRNDGDPRSTGQWNGSGIEGVWVKDNTNDNMYVYRVGDWIQA